MSSQKHTDATLPGYDGPFFPSLVDDLHKQLEQGPGQNHAWLNGIAQIIGGSTDDWLGFTTDRYSWFEAVKVPVNSGFVVILIPWWSDRLRTDGTSSDRSIAVYTCNCNESAAEDIVQALLNAVILQQDQDANAPVSTLGKNCTHHKLGNKCETPATSIVLDPHARILNWYWRCEAHAGLLPNGTKGSIFRFVPRELAEVWDFRFRP